MKKNKKTSSNKDNGSLKTFFLYALVVLFIILVSLSVKAIFLIKQSKFDGKNITVALLQDKKIVGVVGFNTAKNSMSYLKIKNNSSESLPKEKLGIIPDAKIKSSTDLAKEDIETVFSKAMLPANSIQTDLTIFDKIRLIMHAKSVQAKDRHEDEITHRDGEREIDKKISDLFTDDIISSENLSIQILNSTNVSGLGRHLERIIANKGGNVVAVSSYRSPKVKSKIQFFGNNSYTLEKFKKMLNLPGEKKLNKSIADVTIIIGEDYKNTKIYSFSN